MGIVRGCVFFMDLATTEMYAYLHTLALHADLPMSRGVALPMATTLLGSIVLAAGPQRGGHLKCGLQGGASTDVLDTAKCTSQVCFMTGRNWGDTLIESHPTSGEPVAALAESWSASPDAKVWTFKIRKGVQIGRASCRERVCQYV